MSALQFIASLANSLAWPAAATIVLVVLRNPLGKILTRGQIRRLKAGPSGFELEYFDEKLQEANNALSESPTEAASLIIKVLPQSPDIATARDDFMNEMLQLAEIAPSAAILESYSRLEKVLRENIQWSPQAGATPKRPVSIRSLGRQALEQKAMSQPEYAALIDVAVMRNLVAHGEAGDDLDKDRALSYVEIIRQLITSILLNTSKRNGQEHS